MTASEATDGREERRIDYSRLEELASLAGEASEVADRSHRRFWDLQAAAHAGDEQVVEELWQELHSLAREALDVADDVERLANRERISENRRRLR